MANESVATSSGAEVQIDSQLDIGLPGLLRILMRHSYRDGTELGSLSDVELITIQNQANNVKIAALEGLRLMGCLVSSYDEKVGGKIDTNVVGWLIDSLTVSIQEMVEIQSCARLGLEDRGFNWLGNPLVVAAGKTPQQVEA